MSIETDILTTLQATVTAGRNASSVPGLPISYVGVSFNPPNDSKYLEIVHIPNDPSDVYWSNKQVYQGILRVILHWPKTGSGPYPATDLLSSIVNQFQKGTRLANDIQIYQRPKILSSLAQSNEILYPASISYKSLQ